MNKKRKLQQTKNVINSCLKNDLIIFKTRLKIFYFYCIAFSRSADNDHLGFNSTGRPFHFVSEPLNRTKQNEINNEFCVHGTFYNYEVLIKSFFDLESFNAFTTTHKHCTQFSGDATCIA